MFIEFDFLLENLPASGIDAQTFAIFISLSFNALESYFSFDHSSSRGFYSATVVGTDHDIYTQILTPSFNSDVTNNIQVILKLLYLFLLNFIAFCKVWPRSGIFRHIGFFSRVFVRKS